MIFLSDFLRADVLDSEQKPVGRIADLVVQIAEPFPVIHQVILRGKPPMAFSWRLVRPFDGKDVVLRTTHARLNLLPPKEDDIWLARDILDKQIVDTDGRRVVRVNDLQLSNISGKLVVVGVDIGGRGLLRRMGMEEVGKSLLRTTGRTWQQKIISWDAVDPVHSDQSALKLRISHGKLARMHPADIAEVVNRLSAPERQALFSALDDETAAEALEEMSTEDQAEIIERLDDERIADILEEMGPDEAADLLDELPEERARELLKKMEHDEAEEVQELLAYEDDTAGGLMTTEFVTVPSELTAAQAIDRLRELEPDAESVYYMYVVDADERLKGVLSLRDLIVAKPQTSISSITIDKVITVGLEAGHDDVAEVIRKYNLLAVPVVDEEGHLEGIVTVDDVMDSMLSGKMKRRLARTFG